MQSQPQDQILITSFFTALERREIASCESALQQLRLLADTDPIYAPWCTYLDAILANERDNDWAEAERLLLKVMQANPDSLLQLRALYALGRTYDYQGRWSEAIATFKQHLAIATDSGQPVEQAKAWKHMAISYQNGFAQAAFSAEVLQSAISYCRQALDILHTVATTQPIQWLEGSVWNTLGALYMNLRQWDQAIEAYQRDQELCRALDDQHGAGVSSLNIGEVYHKSGPTSWPQALAAYQDALHCFRTFHNQYLEADVLANLAHLHDEMGQPSQALNYYRQAITLIEQLRAGVSSEVGRAGFFATVIDTYANAILLCLNMSYLAEAFNYTERARARAFLDLLAAHEPALSRYSALPTTTLAQVQAALPSDVLLISYFTTGLIEARGGAAVDHQAHRHRFPPARTIIMAVTSNDLLVHDAAIAPNDLRPQRLDNVVERHFLQPAIRRALYEKLIAPVTKLLRSKRRVYLVPHGPLHYIPFPALIATDQQTLLQAGGPEIVYTPSATFMLRTETLAHDVPAGTCLSLGFNDTNVTRLRFAEAEAAGIARLTNGVGLIGPIAKKAALYQSAADYRLLHISCHGDFNPDSPFESGLQLAPGERLTAADVFEQLRLRCKLVTLSACESGLSRVRRGDELAGLSRAFMYAGARAVIATLWRVDEQSTWILMERFYQELQNETPIATALMRAQIFLMNLTRQEARDWLSQSSRDAQLYQQPLANAELNDFPTQTGSQSLQNDADDDRVFADPYYWAPFILIADHSLA